MTTNEANPSCSETMDSLELGAIAKETSQGDVSVSDGFSIPFSLFQYQAEFPGLAYEYMNG